MNGAELKAKVSTGGIVYGAMLSMARNPRWGASMAAFGLDYVIIDMEHSPRSRAEVADFIASFQYTGVAPFVRIPIPAAHYVTMMLDAGAQGILAPYCETVEQVKEVVAAAKWRPLKGVLGRAAVEKGEFPSQATKEYLENRNRNNVCIIGIESPEGIKQLPDILKIHGVDAIFVGPNDLTVCLGIPDQYDNPKYEEALRTILRICKQHNTPVLMHHQSVALTKKWLREGARFVLYSSDAREMHNAFRDEFGEIKEVGEELTGQAAGEVGESEEVI